MTCPQDAPNTVVRGISTSQQLCEGALRSLRNLKRNYRHLVLLTVSFAITTIRTSQPVLTHHCQPYPESLITVNLIHYPESNLYQVTITYNWYKILTYIHILPTSKRLMTLRRNVLWGAIHSLSSNETLSNRCAPIITLPTLNRLNFVNTTKIWRHTESLQV